MASQIEVEPYFVACPHCHVMMQSPGLLVEFILYPDDTAEISLLLGGQLNAIRHICGSYIAFPGPLILYNPGTNEMASNADLPEMPLPPDVQLPASQRVETYQDYLRVLHGWIWDDVGKVLAPGPVTAALFDLAYAEFFESVTPVALIAFKAHRDGNLLLMLAPDTPFDGDEHIRELGLHLTVKALRMVVDLVAWNSQAAEIFEELSRRVPSASIDDAVLHELSAATREFLMDESAHPMAQWRSGMADAVAHAAAGRVCPESGPLLSLLFGLWKLGQRENVELDPRMWITPEVMRRIVDPAALFTLLDDVLKHREEDTAEAVINDLSEFAATLGHSKTVASYLSTIRAELSNPSKSQVAKMIDRVAEVTATRSTDQSTDEWERGRALGSVTWKVIGRLSEKLARYGYDRARSTIPEANGAELFGYDCSICQQANLDQRTNIAGASAINVLNAWADDEIVPDWALFGINEAGNTLRILGKYEEALQTYEIAEQIGQFVDDYEADVVARNKAIVLRDMGDFAAARDLLVPLIEANPDAIDAQESLAVVYMRSGDYPQALATIDRILARVDLDPANRRRVNGIKGTCYAFAGNAEAAVAYLQEEMHAQPLGSPLRLRTLTMLARVDSDDPTTQGLLERCASEIYDTALQGARSNLGVAVTAAGLLALRRVRQGDREGAQAAYELCQLILGPHNGPPWQVDLVRAWLAIGVDDEVAADAIRSVIFEVDDDVPSATNADFAMTWMGDADIALLQSISAELAITRGVRDENLEDVLASYDLQNGRELTSVAGRRQELPSIGRVSSHLRAFQATNQTDVVAVLDTAEHCSLLIIPLDGNPEIVPLARTEDVTAALRPLSYPINPIAPESMDALMHPWWGLASAFAAIVRDRLPVNRALTILEGSRLIATPLHAAGWPADPLILDRPVSFAINNRLLLGAPPRAEKDGTTALICPKAGDRAEFVTQLEAVRTSFTQAGYAVIWGTDVDETSVVRALRSSREVILLCHGVASATALEGPGICVAASGTLPPPALLVDRDPALHAFVVTWRDLASLESTPEIVISLACSSGRTRAGRGGTRIGLDQALVGRSTSHLISPIWNVAQTSAVEWFQALTEARAHQPLRDAYRTAVLQIAQRYPHPYHWAPFTLRSHYQGPNR